MDYESKFECLLDKWLEQNDSREFRVMVPSNRPFNFIVKLGQWNEVKQVFHYVEVCSNDIAYAFEHACIKLKHELGD